MIPTKIGGHSPIKHVFVVVKENRTYDQVLGDLGEGNGDPELAQFGQKITPNAHALAKRFGDLDDFYDEGTLSADGHNWIVQAEANDYVEKEFGAFYRSYPAEGGDALAYQRDGFLWNAPKAAGQSVKDFGEYNRYITTGPGDGGNWKEWFEDSQILEGKASGPLPIPIERIPDQLRHPLAERNHRPQLPEVRPRNSRPVPVRHLEGRIRTRGKRQRRPQPDADLAARRPHRRRAGPGGPGGRQRPRRSGGSWKRSRTASSGRNRRSSASRTTRRTGSTTSTDTAARRS